MLHGMAGVGTAGIDSYQWVQEYDAVVSAMGPGAVAGFGTDTNGLALGMPPSGPQVKLSPKYQPCVAAAVRSTCLSGDSTASQYAVCVKNAEAACMSKFPPACAVHCDRPLIHYTDSFQRSTLGNGTWDYNFTGVAHYGMLPDFLLDVRNVPAPSPGALSGAQLIDTNLMKGAEYFFQTWKLCEKQSAVVNNAAK
jgi:hypothetical protein